MNNEDDIKPIPFNTNYKISKSGNVFKPDGTEMHQFNSSGYKQVCISPPDGSRRKVFGVHQLVAMTFDPSYTSDCVVHHKDKNKLNNNINNLECKSRSEHSKEHADPTSLIKYAKEHGPINKGKKMSKEFRQKCHDSAIKRWKKEKKK